MYRALPHLKKSVFTPVSALAPPNLVFPMWKYVPWFKAASFVYPSISLLIDESHRLPWQLFPNTTTLAGRFLGAVPSLVLCQQYKEGFNGRRCSTHRQVVSRWVFPFLGRPKVPHGSVLETRGALCGFTFGLTTYHMYWLASLAIHCLGLNSTTRKMSTLG